MTMLVLYFDDYYMYGCEQLTVILLKTSHFQAKYIVPMSTEMGYDIRWRHTKFITFKHSLDVVHSTILFDYSLV